VGVANGSTVDVGSAVGVGVGVAVGAAVGAGVGLGVGVTIADWHPATDASTSPTIRISRRIATPQNLTVDAVEIITHRIG
jgi:hypothetical protein